MKFTVEVVDISDVPGFMRIDFHFTCRECGEDVHAHWDTSHEVPVELFCYVCSHVSGELSPTYTFREEHRSRWERAESAT